MNRVVDTVLRNLQHIVRGELLQSNINTFFEVANTADDVVSLVLDSGGDQLVPFVVQQAMLKKGKKGKQSDCSVLTFNIYSILAEQQDI